jgi:transposase
VRDDAITVELGLEGFRVIETIENDHRVAVVIETRVPAGVCPRCGHGTAEGKGRRDRVLRDIPVRGKPTWIRWRRRAFRCRGCAHRFLERHELVPQRVRAMPRFERYIYERTRHGMISLSLVARIERVSFYRAQTAHTKGARGDLEQELFPIRFLAVDEAKFGRGPDYNTIISAPERGRVLDLVRGRDGKGFEAWAASLPPEIRQGVEVFCADLWEPYHQVAAKWFPGAVRVGDKFHVLRHVGFALDRVRIDAQKRAPRGGKRRPYRSRRELLRGAESLTDNQRVRLRIIFRQFPDIEAAWRLKEAARVLYMLTEPEELVEAFETWCFAASTCRFPAFRKVAGTFRHWREEILAYSSDPVTNAFAEGITNKIKVIKRVGFGYRNVERFRERVLVACR